MLQRTTQKTPASACTLPGFHFDFDSFSRLLRKGWSLFWLHI
jgi:hypothetical protein